MEKEEVKGFLYELKGVIYERTKSIIKKCRDNGSFDEKHQREYLGTTNELCNLLLNIENIEKEFNSPN